MPDDSTKLEKTLTLAPAIGLAITMVVGSGLLVLPGLAYASARGASIYAWLISALVSIPLLIIFAHLGANIPGAGGIAGFVQATFSRRLGAATEILVLGTIPGGAAIALTGGQYFAAVFQGQDWLVVIGTLLVLVVGGVVNFFGAKVSGRIQQVLAYTLIALLGGVAVLALVWGNWQAGTGIAGVSHALEALPAVGAVFFAFVGWELMSFTTEEFKDPKRDFPLAIGGSFIIIVCLYTLIVVAFQFVLSPSNPRLQVAPMTTLLASVLGEASGQFVAGIGFLIILANFISVVWAFSRLAFSSAREGLLPGLLSRMSAGQIPRHSVVAMTCTFGLVTILYFVGLVTQSLLFELAGTSFFLAYVLCVLAYLRRAASLPSRLFGVITLLFVALVFGSFGYRALYPLIVLLLGLGLSGVTGKWQVEQETA